MVTVFQSRQSCRLNMCSYFEEKTESETSKQACQLSPGRGRAGQQGSGCNTPPSQPAKDCKTLETLLKEMSTSKTL